MIVCLMCNSALQSVASGCEFGQPAISDTLVQSGTSATLVRSSAVLYKGICLLSDVWRWGPQLQRVGKRLSVIVARLTSSNLSMWRFTFDDGFRRRCTER